MGKGGGGGGQPTQTTSNVTNTNVPEYARPYVENMLGATQQQLFKMDGNQITGFQPYKAYGGTYDAAGNQIAYDPSKSIAGFSPLQQKAMGMANGPEGFAQNVGGYMSPYMQNVVDIQKREAMRQSGIQGAQQQAQAAQVGAFGGSRDAIMRAERERNLGQQMNDIQAQGLQAAFANAQNQFNTNLGQMTAAGALQQQNQQQIINQAMQDYANAQQYPLMQLGTMSNMLRGLPMQAQTTQQYQAQANPITQGIGAIGTLGSLAQMKAEGGAVKSMASGGITSIPRYDVGGSVISQLATMPDEALRKEAMESPSPRVREMAAAILKQRQAGMNAGPQTEMAPSQGVGPMGVDYNANYAGGGIIAFADGKKVNAEEAARLANQTKMYIEGARLAAEQRAREAAEQRAKEAAAASEKDIPLNMATPPARPSIVGGIKSALQSVADKVSGSKPESMMLDTTEAPSIKPRPPALPPLTEAQKAAMDANILPVSGNRGVVQRMSATAAPADAPVAPAPAAPAVVRAPSRGVVVPAASMDAGIRQASDGIARAVPTVPEVVPEAAPAGITSATAPAAPAVDPLASMKAAVAKAQGEADKTQEQRYADKLAARKAQGLDNDEARQKYMQDLMSQKANLADEANRTNMLRRAQFFAQWGSTPGNTLVAGMAALRDKIPEIIQDAKDQKLALQQADKAIYELGEATRLEKLGMFDEAGKEKQKAAETAALLQSHLATASASIRGHELSKEGTLGAAAISSEAHKFSAVEAANASKYHTDVSAAAQRYSANVADRAREEAAKGRLTGVQLQALTHASDNLAQLPARLERGHVGDKAYEAAIQQEKMAQLILGNSPENKEMQTQLANAQAKLARYRQADADTIARAQAQVDALAQKAFGPDFKAFSPSAATPTKADPLGLR